MKPLTALRGDLQGILAGKEYQVYYSNQHNLLLDLFNRLKNWLYTILKQAFPHSDIATRATNWLALGLTALGVLLVGLMIFLLFSRFVRPGRTRHKRETIAQGLKLTLHQHLNEAQNLADEGEYGQALRHLFLGYILFLDQNRWIEAKAWKTNWEYYAELRDHAPQLADSFTSLAVMFEEAMYGGRPTAKADYWLCHNQVRKWIQEGEAS